jgi:HlyD family secretion protein
MLGKQNIIKNELGALSKINKNLSDQEREFQQDVKIAEDEYKTNLNLFFEGVISLLDLKNCQSKFIAKKMQLKQLQSSIINNTSSEISTSKQLVDISDNLEQEKLNFIKVLNLLKNEIAIWKNNYILISPESGKVMFSASIEEYQLYDRNKELFYIMPTDIRYVGEIFIDQYNLGKLENGQKIVIKLKSYPYEEYGVLTGKIENISEVDVNKQYLIKVDLDNGLVTNIGKILKFRYGMVGNASIITKEMKVIDKLIYKLKKI